MLPSSRAQGIVALGDRSRPDAEQEQVEGSRRFGGRCSRVVRQQQTNAAGVEGSHRRRGAGEGFLSKLANTALAAFNITPESLEKFNVSTLDTVLGNLQKQLGKISNLPGLSAFAGVY